MKQIKICSVKDCGKPHCAKGFCYNHYCNNRYATDPEFREKEKQRKNKKYADDPEFREKEKQRQNDKYANDPEFKEKCKQQRKDYLQTEHGREVIYKKNAKRQRNLQWIPLCDNFWPDNIEIDWHHINNQFVFPIPKITHKSMYGKDHRKKVNNWLEEVIGLVGV